MKRGKNMNRTNTGANSNLGMIFADILALALAFLISLLIWSRDINAELLTDLSVLTLVFALIFMLASKGQYLYNVTLFYYLDRIYKKVTKAFFLAVIATFLIKTYLMNPQQGMQFYLTFLVLAYISVCLKVLLYRALSRQRPLMKCPRTAFVGDIGAFDKFFYFVKKTSIRFESIGYIAKTREEYEKARDGLYIGCLDELEEVIKKYNLDQVYFIQKTAGEILMIQKYIDLCEDMGVTLRLIVDFYESKSDSYVSSVGTYPIITYHTISLNVYEQVLKRSIDMLGGLIGIILFSPIMLITTIAIKLDSPGPVIFKQKRVGQNGREFSIYKFRSMHTDAEARKAELMKRNEIQGESGCMFKMKNDPRVTRVGKFIRKYSIDEFPQFFNVLKGDMSLVGTRPPTLDEVSMYKRNQWRRISIKPGLTGMWQVNGRSNICSFEEVVKMDVFYIDNWSLTLDLKIIFKTIQVLINSRGAY